ncbi:MAG: hypothetical protein KF824_02545 [Fimbriimonadaceae bacterium]|nr:MAG: hypothetical protein KF824_02545 [Fimbriimonadaceae bacterium]
MLKLLRSQGCMTVSLILLIVVIIAIPVFAFKVFDDVMFPPPNAQHFEQFENHLTADGLPIEAEKLIAVETDRPSYVGEGRLTESWEKIKALADADLIDEWTVILITKEGDWAKVRLLTGDRVRVLTGTHLKNSEVNALFDQEFDTVKGKHPPYNKQE